MAKNDKKNDESLLKAFEKFGVALKKMGDRAAVSADRQLGVTGMIRGQIGQIEKLQAGMLARGSDLAGLIKSSGDVTRQLTEGVGGLNSGLAGYQDAVGAAADAYRSGMDTNNYAVNRLLLRSKFTDKQSQQLAHAMRAATAGTGISKQGMTELATTVQSLSERFNISSGQLMGAMSALGKSLKMMKGLGIAKAGQEVAALFGAALGTGAEKFGAEFISKIAAGDAIKTRSMLGIQQKMQGFYKGGEGAAKALTQATVAAAFEVKKQVVNYTKGAAAFGQAYALGNEQFGGVWDEGMMLYNEMVSKYGDVSEATMIAMMEKEAADKEIQNKFTETWTNVKSQIFGPLMEGLIKFQAGFYKLIEKPWFKNIIKVLSGVVIAIAAWKLVISPLMGAFSAMNDGRKKLGKELTKLKDSINKNTMKQTRTSKGQYAGKKGVIDRAQDKSGEWIDKLKLKITGSDFFQKLKGGLSKRAGEAKDIGKKVKDKSKEWIGKLTSKLQNSPFGKSISSGFGKISKGIGGFGKMIFGGILKGLAWFGSTLVGIIGSIPVIGWIFLAIVGLVALIIYFWEPIKKTFVSIWNWLKSIPSKIMAGFKKGFWAGIWALLKILFIVPTMIITGIWNVIKWLALKLLDGLAWIVSALNPLNWFGSDDEAKSDEEANSDSLAEQKKTNELGEVQAKDSQANIDQRNRDNMQAQQRQTTNELLRKLNEGLDAEHIRSEAAENLREQTLVATKAIEENSGRRGTASTQTAYKPIIMRVGF